MGKIIFVLGGTRSGKSNFAVELAKKISNKVAFIATCLNPDDEMKRRIRRHKLSRPKDWKLIEEGKDITSVLMDIQKKNESNVTLIDCLGLWLSNLLMDNLKDAEIKNKISQFIHTLSELRYNTILVSNEVGFSIIPDNVLARRFQDLIGLANQMIAQKADEVIFMQAGIPLKIKGGQMRT